MNLMKYSVILSMLLACTCFGAAPAAMDGGKIIADAQSVADAQMHAMGDTVSLDWTWGVMDVGYTDFAPACPHGPDYIRALTNIADKTNWTLPTRARNNLFADDYCVGQTFLALDLAHPVPGHLQSTRQRLDLLVDHINHEKPGQTLAFSWCDALFMAPPLMSRMSAATGDRKYIDAMDREFWQTTALLYDRDEHLFYRDARFLEKKDSHGQKIFWSRGNGWVVAGIARILEYMPQDYPSRPRYESLLKAMAARLITLQQTDGTWPPSLIDPAEFPSPETSGTGLITYGLAWGIHHNLLDRATYLPVVTRAWDGLLRYRRPDGLPGYSQAPSYKPDTVKSDGTQVYTTGAILMTAVQLHELATDGKFP